ncbi:hypothetical protein KCU88_g140, partial [Aureobasidium melanogenum]
MQHLPLGILLVSSHKDIHALILNLRLHMFDDFGDDLGIIRADRQLQHGTLRIRVLFEILRNGLGEFLLKLVGHALHGMSVLAGDGDDSPNALGNPALFENDKILDVSGTPDVGTAAELDTDCPPSLVLDIFENVVHLDSYRDHPGTSLPYTGQFCRMYSVEMSSIFARSASDTGALTSRNAKLRMCVPVWLLRMGHRLNSSYSQIATSPVEKWPYFMYPVCST